MFFPLKNSLIAVVAMLLFGALFCQPGQADTNYCVLEQNIDPAVVISTPELTENFDSFHFVDTRSRLEYDVIHAKGAHHVSVVAMTKDDLVKILESDETPKKIVLYCNGGR